MQAKKPKGGGGHAWIARLCWTFVPSQGEARRGSRAQPAVASSFGGVAHFMSVCVCPADDSRPGAQQRGGCHTARQAY